MEAEVGLWPWLVFTFWSTPVEILGLIQSHIALIRLDRSTLHQPNEHLYSCKNIYPTLIVCVTSSFLFGCVTLVVNVVNVVNVVKVV